MKKNIIGFCVFVAIISFAFTRSKMPAGKSPRGFMLYAYQLSTFTRAQVQSVAKTSWKQFGVMCTSGSNKPCGIVVDAIYTHTDGSGDIVLNDATFTNHITIIASQGMTGAFKVDAISVNILTIMNKN